MQLRNIMKDFIVEGRVEDLTKKYPDLDVQDVSENDPSPNKKYLAWMCKQLDSGMSKNDLYPTVKSFDKNIGRIKNKDINSYKTAKDLENVIKSLSEKSKKKQKEEVKSNAPKIYEDENIVIVRPDDKNSCMVYGSGTKWCITMKNESYYEQYTSDNVVFYYLLSKKLPETDPKSKIALAVLRNEDNKMTGWEMYDAEDNRIGQYSPVNDDEWGDVDFGHESHQSDWPKNLLDSCISDAEKRPMGLLAKIKSGKASDEELEHIASSDDESHNDARYDLARNTKTSPEILDKLAHAYLPTTDEYNAGTSQEQARKRKIHDNQFDVFERLAINWSIKPETLDYIYDALLRDVGAGEPTSIDTSVINRICGNHNQCLFHQLPFRDNFQVCLVC